MGFFRFINRIILLGLTLIICNAGNDSESDLVEISNHSEYHLSVPSDFNFSDSAETFFTNVQTSSIGCRTRNNVNIRRSSSASGADPLIRHGKILKITCLLRQTIDLARYPSGLKESSHWLISLGKLII